MRNPCWLALGVVTIVVSAGGAGLAEPLSFSPSSPPFKIVDSSTSKFGYAYAPSIIFAEGQYHAYFCSGGTGPLDWDHVRHATSPDLVSWSGPVDVLSSTSVERANCDPS